MGGRELTETSEPISGNTPPLTRPHLILPEQFHQPGDQAFKYAGFWEPFSFKLPHTLTGGRGVGGGEELLGLVEAGDGVSLSHTIHHRSFRAGESGWVAYIFLRETAKPSVRSSEGL